MKTREPKEGVELCKLSASQDQRYATKPLEIQVPYIHRDKVDKCA